MFFIHNHHAPVKFSNRKQGSDDKQLCSYKIHQLIFQLVKKYPATPSLLKEILMLYAHCQSTGTFTE